MTSNQGQERSRCRCSKKTVQGATREEWNAWGWTRSCRYADLPLIYTNMAQSASSCHVVLANASKAYRPPHVSLGPAPFARTLPRTTKLGPTLSMRIIHAPMLCHRCLHIKGLYLSGASCPAVSRSSSLASGTFPLFPPVTRLYTLIVIPNTKKTHHDLHAAPSVRPHRRRVCGKGTQSPGHH